MNDLLERDDHYIHGILIVKDGKLVFEEYFTGYDLDIFRSGLNMEYKEFDRNTLHFQASVTKSVISALVGIATDKGHIQGVDEKVFSFFREYADLNKKEKDKITIAHVLAMSSGFPWDESSYPYDDNRNDVNRFINSSDPMRFILGRNLIASPGLAFLYNSGDTNVLGEIVRKTSEFVLMEFAKRYLFTPLGISSFQWLRLPYANEVTFASGGLYLLPRDMAKIGQLYLQEGLWKGNRIISAEWVRESIKKSIDLPAYMRVPYHAYGYGYQWWLETYQSGPGTIYAYSAHGWGNQFIVVLKEVNMVVVFTGGAYETNSSIVFSDIIQNYILPAVD